MDGYEVCRRLKADERLRDIPVLFISAMNEVEGKVRAFALGGTDYVTKPFQPEEVLARVRSQLHRRRLWLKLEDQKNRMNELVRTDSLTNLLNRRAFMEGLDQEINRQQRYSNPLSLFMVDLDHFKIVNDTYGHAGGDEVLCHFAKLLRETIRTTDIPGRIGGEEFAVLLPETDMENAVLLAQRLSQAIRSSNVKTFVGMISYTVSIGISQMRSGDSTETLLNRADQAMYRAKENGRDRVEALW
jgi:two-component system, cell cycle response regulator